MAKGQLLTMATITGSLGGLTFKKGKGASVICSKIKPTVKNSSRVSIRRMYVTTYAAFWRTLPSFQRKMWRDASYSGLRGFYLYMYCVLNRTTIGMLGIPFVQPIPRFPFIVTTTPFNSATGAKSLAFGFNPGTNNDFSIEIQATPPLSRGVGVVKDSLFKIVLIVNNAVSGTYAFTSNYLGLFGQNSTSVGERMFTRARIIHKASGYASPWVYNDIVIVA